MAVQLDHMMPFDILSVPFVMVLRLAVQSECAITRTSFGSPPQCALLKNWEWPWDEARTTVRTT